jgi:hypothetical protein
MLHQKYKKPLRKSERFFLASYFRNLNLKSKVQFFSVISAPLSLQAPGLGPGGFSLNRVYLTKINRF